MKVLALLTSVGLLASSASAQCEVGHFSVPTYPDFFRMDLCSNYAGFVGGDGNAALFERQGTDWMQVASIPAFVVFDPAPIAVSDRYVAIGNPFASSVTIYERESDWLVPKQLSFSQNINSNGTGVTFHGDMLLVGGTEVLFDATCGPGRAYVFECFGGEWLETGTFLPYNFGSDIRINCGVHQDTDGQTIAIGAPTESGMTPRAGTVYVYERGPNGWVNADKLYPQSIMNDMNFGRGVAVRGDHMLIGAPLGGAGTGSVHAFERGPNGWVETQEITPPDLDVGDQFGISISIQGTRAAIGAPGADSAASDTGAVYMFERVGSTWVQTDRFEPIEKIPADRMGTAVELNESRLFWAGYRAPARVIETSFGIQETTNFCAVNPNSTGAEALVQAVGCESIYSNDLSVVTSGVPPHAGALTFAAMNAQQLPAYGGFLCLQPPLLRIGGGLADAAGEITVPVDFANGPAANVTAGTTWRFQTIYRDLAVAPNALNFSNGLEIELLP